MPALVLLHVGVSDAVTFAPALSRVGLAGATCKPYALQLSFLQKSCWNTGLLEYWITSLLE